MSLTASAATARPTSHTDPWRGFCGVGWHDTIDTRSFIQANYSPYEGDSTFLSGPAERTRGLWARLSEMFPAERANGVHDIDTRTPSSITSHRPGYIDRESEIVVGLQTDAPLKRAMMPNGGWRMVKAALDAFGYESDRRRAGGDLGAPSPGRTSAGEGQPGPAVRRPSPSSGPRALQAISDRC